MNIDRLHQKVGLDTWTEDRTTGSTIEMHGNILESVCEGEDGHIYTIDSAIERQFRSGKTPACTQCGSLLRPRVMLYEDADGDLMCDDYQDQLEEDMSGVYLVLWIGISFAQAASTEYFKMVRRILREQQQESATNISKNSGSGGGVGVRYGDMWCAPL